MSSLYSLELTWLKENNVPIRKLTVIRSLFHLWWLNKGEIEDGYLNIKRITE
jgi:hypothetical protein